MSTFPTRLTEELALRGTYRPFTSGTESAEESHVHAPILIYIAVTTFMVVIELRQQLTNDVDWAKSMDIGTIAITMPPKRFEKIPAASLDDLRAEMARAQTSAANKLQPRHLVLFSGPFGRLRRFVSSASSPRDWYRTIRDTAREIRSVGMGTRLSISFDGFDVQSEELFRLLDVAESPVDAGRCAGEIARRPQATG